jgi:PAS domain S-box-containing protein
MNSNPVNQAQHLTKNAMPTWLYLLAAFAGLMVVISMIYIFRSGTRMAVVYTPQIDATMEIRLQATQARLWFEEIVDGDTREKIEVVWRFIDDADWYARALLEGGRNQEGRYFPLQDEQLRTKLKTIRDEITQFRAVTQERLQASSESGPGSEIDRRYDNIYRQFVASADDVETDLQKNINADIRRFQTIQTALITVTVILITLVIIGFNFFIARHLNDGQQLRAANQQLHAHEQQLRAANQQLHAANQQLTASDQQLRAMNQQLATSEKRIRSIVESCPMGMYIYELTDNDNLQLIEANPAADQLLGIDHSALIGKTIEEAFPALAATDIPSRYTDIARHGTTWQISSFDYHDSHIKGAFDVFAFQILPRRVCVMFLEVSERKKAESALRALSIRNQAILASVPDIIAEVDADKKYTWLNEAGHEFFGPDAIGTSADEYFHGNQDTYHIVAPIFNGNEDTIYVESWQRRKDGQVRLLAWWCRVLKDTDGNVSGALSTARDITELTHAQRELYRLNKSLEARNRELQSIVYVASHDLRSPLVNIQGFAGELAQHCRSLIEIIQKQNVETTPGSEIQRLIDEDIPEALGFIQAGTGKMQALLDGLLNVSRAGTVELNICKLNISRLIQSVINAMRFEIDERGVTVTTGGLPDCLGDPTQINQVFSNLLNNALKYLSHDRKGIINISGYIENEKAVYCVEDNGIGIEKQHQSKVFEIFHRLNPSEGPKGEGIGLAIVSRILDRHDGRVWVESEFGQGSRFFVSLPAAQ